MATITFTPGTTYIARSVCDHECIFEFTILSRTEKTITTTVRGKVSRFKVGVFQDVEHFYPHGKYSMALSVNADRPKK